MGMKTKLKSFFFLEDEEEEMNEKRVPSRDMEPNFHHQSPEANSNRQNVVSLQSVQKSSKVVLMEPRVYAEAQEIADHLKNRRSVVVNLQRIQHDQAVRIVDFLSGTVYAIGGDIQRIGASIFLCTPDNVEIAGNISELMDGDEFKDLRWT